MTSVDIQLQRDKTGSLPFLSNWSRYEPAALNRSYKGNTDQWSKTKHKNVTIFTTGKDGQTHFYPGERCPHEIPPHEASTHITPHHKIDGKMKHIGTKTFTELLLHELNGNMPGDYYKTRQVPRHMLRTTVNTRARDGFEYWWHETKPVNHATKKWIGSSGCVLGTKRK